MIFHTLHTCTIDNFGLCFEYPENVKRFPIPLRKKVVLKAFKKLTDQWNELTAQDKIDNILEDKYHYHDLENRIQMFYNMYLALKNSIISEVPEVVFEEFKAQFRKDFEYSDLDSILNKIKILKSKQTAVVVNIESSGSKKFDFEELVDGVERYIYPRKIRDEKLIRMPRYMKQADEAKKLAETNNG